MPYFAVRKGNITYFNVQLFCTVAKLMGAKETEVFEIVYTEVFFYFNDY
jgi:hypothetical protein